MVEEKPASEIGVHQFRLLFQWPLILSSEGGAEALDCARKKVLREVQDSKIWCEADPLTVLPKAAPGDGDSYAEFVYFHDFAQAFLYPKIGDANASFALFRRCDIKQLNANFGTFDLTFDVERLTLHLFDLGVAVLSLELNHVPGAEELTFARCQTAIDYLRRTYVPFWDDEKNPMRVPKSVSLDHGTTSTPPSPDEAAKCLNNHDSDRTPVVFEHWRELIRPLKLLNEDGGVWRDPSDERVPVNSFISLTPKGYDDLPKDAWTEKAEKDRAAVLQVKESDWFRLWDAEEAGADYPYNPEFSKPSAVGAFYDRFFPDARSGGLAGRHLFGEHHYCFVGSGSFTDNVLLHHWRRHYAQLSLVARFQATMLLALSSRITRALDKLGDGPNREPFNQEILNIQDDYLRYRHRYHFTGVSSQIQAAEMYERWMQVLQIEALHRDVQDELATATDALHANEQTRLANGANRLGLLAGVGVFGGLIVGALGSNIIIGGGQVENLFHEQPEWWQSAVVVAAATVFFAFGYEIASRLFGHGASNNTKSFGTLHRLVTGVIGLAVLGGLFLLPH